MAPSDNTTTIPDTSAKVVDLVNQARAGNRSALARLADQFHQEIFRMVFYRIRSRVDAEDITQDVFLKAFQKISSVKEAAKFRGWLFSIALNRIRDFQRKKRFRSLFKKEDENIESHPSEKTMEREVFLLRFFDHLSIKEIAGALKKNESTVKTHLYRALAKFKKEPAMRQLLHEINR